MRWILLFLIVFIVGCQEVEIVQPETVQKDIPKITPELMQKCNDYCLDYPETVKYFVNYKEEFVCSCLDQKEKIIVNSTDFVDFVFDEKLRWSKMPVTYSIVNKDKCGSYEIRKIKRGFDRIQEATDDAVYFEEADNGDIEIKCSFIEDCYELKVDVRKEEGITYKYESICEYAKGIAQITEVRGNKILKANIEMVGLSGFAETEGVGASGFYIGSCGHPTTEIHEILHTFGFGHKDDPESIMYFQEDSVALTLQKPGDCIGSDKKIDKDIISELKEIYGSNNID